MKKNIHQLKTGDIVNFHGGKFLITEDATHAYMQDGLEGPSDVAIAKSICIEGECGGYFSGIHKTKWSFQGNFLRGALELN